MYLGRGISIYTYLSSASKNRGSSTNSVCKVTRLMGPLGPLTDVVLLLSFDPTGGHPPDSSPRSCHGPTELMEGPRQIYHDLGFYLSAELLNLSLYGQLLFIPKKTCVSISYLPAEIPYLGLPSSSSDHADVSSYSAGYCLHLKVPKYLQRSFD